MKIIDTHKKIAEKINKFQSRFHQKDWKITYISSLHGAWDMILECAFSELDDLNIILDYCRTDKELINWIEATTTFISIKKNFIL